MGTHELAMELSAINGETLIGESILLTTVEVVERVTLLGKVFPSGSGSWLQWGSAEWQTGAVATAMLYGGNAMWGATTVMLALASQGMPERLKMGIEGDLVHIRAGQRIPLFRMQYVVKRSGDSVEIEAEEASERSQRDYFLLVASVARSVARREAYRNGMRKAMVTL